MSERNYGDISWGDGTMSAEQKAEFEALEEEITQQIPNMSLTSREDVAGWMMRSRENEQQRKFEIGEKVSVRTRIEWAIDNLIEKGILVEQDGKLSLAQPEKEETK